MVGCGCGGDFGGVYVVVLNKFCKTTFVKNMHDVTRRWRKITVKWYLMRDFIGFWVYIQGELLLGSVRKFII